MDNKNFTLLTELPMLNQALFGACCLDRIIHLYNLFQDEILDEPDEYFVPFKSGYTILKENLDIAFQIIHRPDEKRTLNFKRIKEKCLELTPDTEMVSDNNVVLAQNVSIGVSYIFDFYQSGNVQFIKYCSDKLIDCIDMIAFNNNATDDEKEKLLKKENLLQFEYLNKIKNLGNRIDEADINTIRLINENNIISS